MTLYPSSFASVGKKRCIPLKSFILLTHSARKALSEHPTSRMVSCESQFRTPLAIRLDTRRSHESCRFSLHPHTASHSPIKASSLGMSSGSFWRSASIVMTTRPRAAWNPAANAALCPQFRLNLTRWRAGNRTRRSFMTCQLLSEEPSSTRTISYGLATPSMARATPSTRGGRLSSSL